MDQLRAKIMAATAYVNTRHRFTTTHEIYDMLLTNEALKRRLISIDKYDVLICNGLDKIYEYLESEVYKQEYEQQYSFYLPKFEQKVRKIRNLALHKQLKSNFSCHKQTVNIFSELNLPEDIQKLVNTFY